MISALHNLIFTLMVIGSRVEVDTLNSTYKIKKVEKGFMISGSPIYCPKPLFTPFLMIHDGQLNYQPYGLKRLVVTSRCQAMRIL